MYAELLGRAERAFALLWRFLGGNWFAAVQCQGNRRGGRADC